MMRGPEFAGGASVASPAPSSRRRRESAERSRGGDAPSTSRTADELLALGEQGATLRFRRRSRRSARCSRRRARPRVRLAHVHRGRGRRTGLGAARRRRHVRERAPARRGRRRRRHATIKTSDGSSVPAEPAGRRRRRRRHLQLLAARRRPGRRPPERCASDDRTRARSGPGSLVVATVRGPPRRRRRALVQPAGATRTSRSTCGPRSSCGPASGSSASTPSSTTAAATTGSAPTSRCPRRSRAPTPSARSPSCTGGSPPRAARTSSASPRSCHAASSTAPGERARAAARRSPRVRGRRHRRSGRELALTLLRATGYLSRSEPSLRPNPAGPLDPLEGRSCRAGTRSTTRCSRTAGLARRRPARRRRRVLVPLERVRAGGGRGREPVGGAAPGGRRPGGGGDARAAADRRPAGVQPVPTPSPVDGPPLEQDGAPVTGWTVDLVGRPVERFEGAARAAAGGRSPRSGSARRSPEREHLDGLVEAPERRRALSSRPRRPRSSNRRAVSASHTICSGSADADQPCREVDDRSEHVAVPGHDLAGREADAQRRERGDRRSSSSAMSTASRAVPATNIASSPIVFTSRAPGSRGRGEGSLLEPADELLQLLRRDVLRQRRVPDDVGEADDRVRRLLRVRREAPRRVAPARHRRDGGGARSRASGTASGRPSARPRRTSWRCRRSCRPRSGSALPRRSARSRSSLSARRAIALPAVRTSASAASSPNVASASWKKRKSSTSCSEHSNASGDPSTKPNARQTRRPSSGSMPDRVIASSSVSRSVPPCSTRSAGMAWRRFSAIATRISSTVAPSSIASRSISSRSLGVGQRSGRTARAPRAAGWASLHGIRHAVDPARSASPFASSLLHPGSRPGRAQAHAGRRRPQQRGTLDRATAPRTRPHPRASARRAPRSAAPATPRAARAGA